MFNLLLIACALAVGCYISYSLGRRHERKLAADAAPDPHHTPTQLSLAGLHSQGMLSWQLQGTDLNIRVTVKAAAINAPSRWTFVMNGQTLPVTAVHAHMGGRLQDGVGLVTPLGRLEIPPDGQGPPSWTLYDPNPNNPKVTQSLDWR